MDDLDTTAMETAIRQRNLKLAWQGRLAFTDDEREHLYAAAFAEFGVDWIRRIQEP